MPSVHARTVPATVLAHRGESGPISPAVEEFAEEMIARWRRGERPLVEEFLGRRPELYEQPAAAFELIAEELALRAEFGQPLTLADWHARFPQWSAPVAALVEWQEALGGSGTAPRFPAAGECLGDFRLVAELGRGAHGQVYLAVQPDLAERLVVLKLGPAGTGEHLCLARLQHTHIVPLYSAHEFPDRGLSGFCMPYFGGVTLAKIIDAIVEQPPRLRAGRDLCELLRRVESDLDVPIAASPALAFLEHAGAAEAVCWIGACLADALQYAHDRGLLHLDIKPSNVLLAADGTPMLLDFHLARAALAPGDPAPLRLGGTMGFMPPEQRAALQAVAKGTALAEGIDARADVYALGVLLTEFWRKLSGTETINSRALHDVLARCTTKAARDRYPTAALVAADLRRHLADLPVRGVPNRSLFERWSKWRRRRPFAWPLLLTLAALVLIVVGLWIRAGQQVRRAEAALRDGEQQRLAKRYRAAAEACQSGEAIIAGLPWQGDLRERLRATRRDAERGLLADRLHAVCEHARPLFVAESLGLPQLQIMAAQCRTLWDQRAAMARQLAANGDDAWRGDLLDLGILTAYFEAKSAPVERQSAVREAAAATLMQAEEMFGTSRVLTLELARYGYATELTAGNVEPRTAWDYLVIGRTALSTGELASAAAALERSVALEPQSLWANYYSGVCNLRQGRTAEALAAFSVAVALAPDSSWCLHNRGLANQKAARFEQAQADLDRAIELDPRCAPAYLSRAALHHQLGRIVEAFYDLRRAETTGADIAEVRYRSAVVHLADNDRAGALLRLNECLAANPGHVAARELLTSLKPEQ